MCNGKRRQRRHLTQESADSVTKWCTAHTYANRNVLPLLRQYHWAYLMSEKYPMNVNGDIDVGVSYQLAFYRAIL
jgi:hypothetical protein